MGSSNILGFNMKKPRRKYKWHRELKNQKRIAITIPDTQTIHCQDLFFAVIIKALVDICEGSKQQITEWMATKDYLLVCFLADVNPDNIRRVADYLITKSMTPKEFKEKFYKGRIDKLLFN